jgi:hypothetical protein
MATPPIVAIINDALAALKTLAGVPVWRDMNHHGQWRIVMPLLLDGESTGLDLEICAYPNRSPARFTIIIRQPRCVWRLEYDPTAVHTNSLNAPRDILGATINGPHYHTWSDNTRFVTANALPRNLKNARILPKEIQDFDGAFEWFCRQTNIRMPPPGTVNLPPRTELF